MRRFLGLVLVLGAVNLALYIVLELLVLHYLDLRFHIFIEILILPQFEAAVLALALHRNRPGPQVVASRNRYLVPAAAVVAMAALLLPPARSWIVGATLLAAGVATGWSRRLPRVLLGAGMIAAGIEAFHPWVDRAVIRLMPQRIILVQKLSAYALPAFLALVLLVILERSASSSNSRQLIGLAVAALVLAVDIVACNYFLHPFLSRASAATVTVAEIVFALSLAGAFVPERVEGPV